MLNDRTLLATASITAIAVTCLQRIHEIIPFGYEVGVFVAAVAFAYVGAWVFNWVIIERPRARRLGDIYRIAWPALSIAAWSGHNLIMELAWMANADAVRDPCEYDVQELCNQIPYGYYILGTEPIELINSLMDIRNSRLQAVSSFLAGADHELLVALAEVNATDWVILLPMQDFSVDGGPSWVLSVDDPPRHLTFGDIAYQSRNIAKYFEATERLRQCLDHLKYAPGPVGPGVTSERAVYWQSEIMETKATPWHSQARRDVPVPTVRLRRSENPTAARQTDTTSETTSVPDASE